MTKDKESYIANINSKRMHDFFLNKIKLIRAQFRKMNAYFYNKL